MKTYDLNEKAEFSADNPVKRHFLNAKGFHAALICLKKGTEIPPHAEDYAVFLTVLEGSGIFTGSGGGARLGRGEGIYLKKDEIRGIKPESDLVVLGIQDRS